MAATTGEKNETQCEKYFKIIPFSETSELTFLKTMVSFLVFKDVESSFFVISIGCI